ncbi:MAG TPA: NUDIX hydrolase [Jiangellales bacterium]|nr:NUDIX hydrolase [Jiangellales bacterium]
MPARRWLPPPLAERARAFVAGGLTPVQPHAAATVILLRDAAQGLEVYVLRRRSSMAFAAGMHAFAGGRVDTRDVADEGIAWFGLDPAGWAARLGTDEPSARGFLCAAVRETFEEAGVLLAEPNVRADGAGWEADREALVDRRLSLSELFERRGLAVRSDLLAPWAHWITPRFERRRYDTWFFAAALPDGQQARDVSGEADHADWIRPPAAIAAADRGDAMMLPPTRVVLEQLAGYDSVDAVMRAAADRVIETIMPGWVDDGDTVWALLPGDPGYPGDDLR